MYIYSDPTRETDDHALPDVEVFHMTALERAEAAIENGEYSWYDWCANVGHIPANVDHMKSVRRAFAEEECEAGWYYWFCFPGCLPDGEPCGPYPTMADAIAAAREE